MRISSNTDNVFFIHFVYFVLTSRVLKRIAHLTLVITVINYFNGFFAGKRLYTFNISNISFSEHYKIIKNIIIIFTQVCSTLIHLNINKHPV